MLVPRTKLIAVIAGGGGVAALAAAVFPSIAVPVVTLIFLATLAAAWDAFGAARSARGLAVSTPPLIRATRARDMELALTLANHSPAGQVLLPCLALQLPSEFHCAEPAADYGPLLAAAQQVTVSTTFQSARRGEYLLDSCDVRTQSRLGLWDVHRTLPLTTTIRVYPDLLNDDTAATFLQRGQEGTRVIRHTGKGREFEKLRDYLPGDSFDEVDWKATARRGKPVVRVFQVERTQEIYVAVDASRLSVRAAGDEITLDRYVNSALVLALAAEAQGDRFGLLTFSDRVHGFVRAGRGKTHFRACREAIYQLQPYAVEPDFGEVFSFLETRLTKRALVIILTALDDPLAAETFERHVSVANRRHLVIAAMPAPPGTRPLFEEGVGGIDGVYEALGGHLRWRQLGELQKACRRKGVALHFLDPERLSAQLAAIYLEVKRKQQL